MDMTKNSAAGEDSHTGNKKEIQIEGWILHVSIQSQTWLCMQACFSCSVINVTSFTGQIGNINMKTNN